ncbi:TPA: LOW QUALITY PROTEIN: hypothetical protein N0F65_006116 [Lagenidium giganteum]|uniref:E2 ubiquitin-conjugating enzyme n=1 Tax=Lagenidium giganteum TaxID=4803 RepID=A0AAV2Z3Q9_9STRA|nr:TPA: LOW QUALITY PROTEIN: hypothetical protein N0F65_006116 [Lagenidium giganteum]
MKCPPKVSVTLAEALTDDLPPATKMVKLTLEHKIAACIAAWYLLSLITLWTNRYVVAELKVDSNVLSLAQLGMSVVCGFGSEMYLVGWVVIRQGLRQLMREGLKDMIVLGAVRILTVLFGLTALKYIAVSFTQTIKSSAPFFTVILTYLLLGQRTGWRVNVSLLPIVTGLIFCSLSDSSFHPIGFIAAIMSNCVDCTQNVLTKRLLNRSYSVGQLQLYTSVIAVVMQLMFLFYNWFTSPGEAASNDTASGHSNLYLVTLLVIDGLGFYLQSAFAYVLMSLVSPVTHSVANCVKRALLITLSIYHFGDVVTPLNWSGMVLVIVGVYVFNTAARIEREASEMSKGPMLPTSFVQIAKSTISELAEVRVHSGKLRSKPHKDRHRDTTWTMAGAADYARELLRRQFLEMSRNPPEGVSVGLGDDDNIFRWEILLVGPPDTLYEGGFFKAELEFPPNFPNMPPKMTFKSEMWHPNVYANGVVCISILHPPGEDQLNSQETADERWRPILGVESILVSVISMLSDPNDDSPANIDAAVEWRNDKDAFKKHCRRIVRKSQEDI